MSTIREGTAGERLSEKEERLLQALRDDMTLNEAADKCSMSISTANQHMSAIKQKLGVRTMHGALLKWVQHD